MKYDNATKYKELISTVYKVQEIENFIEQTKRETMSFRDFKKRFNVECVRKTSQGYYVILLQEDGKKVFSFFDDNQKLTTVIVVEDFISKDKFDALYMNESTINQILSLDSNAIQLSTSAKLMSAHIVSDGMFVITYSRYGAEREILIDPTVESIEFISDEELLSGANDIIYLVPLVLPLDKT